MPRRGEVQHNFPAPAQPRPPLERVGLRVVKAPDRTGTMRTLTLDPTEFVCTALAAELADEWSDYSSIAQLTGFAGSLTRRAIRDFCRQVDLRLGEHACRASLARAEPDLATVLADWERTLPSRFRAGSTRPATLAAAVRALIARRAQHHQRPVAGSVRRLVDGVVGVAAGGTQEVDEFTRADKRALVRAAWEWVNRAHARRTEGWAAAARGRHPGEHGWLDAANLLWGLANKQIAPEEIRDNLPAVHHWPASLRSWIDLPDSPKAAPRAKELLARTLVARLYPSPMDLHAYRVLLVAATGHAPEELTGLTVDDVEILPAGVRLTLIKRRAQRIRHRTFTAAAFDGNDAVTDPHHESVTFTDRPHREVGEIIGRLIRAGEPIRNQLPGARHLFMTATVVAGGQLRLARWNYNSPRARFAAWVDAAGVSIDGPCDIRRLRKATKVEKALAFGGRIADTANDHHEEVFRGHYAQGTTLRMMSGRVISNSQDHWFTKAVAGPTVLTTSTEVLESAEPATLGLTRQQAEELRDGALDMGLTQCSDPHNSPFGRAGQLCPVAPLRCLECRNAWILPTNLPQLLLFADHLDKLRRRLSPEHFAQLWGQTHTNLHAVLAEHTPESQALARTQIQEGTATLHLPLAANVEFDR